MTKATRKKRAKAPEPAQLYPRDKVLTDDQLAKALQVSVRTIERMDLPTVYFGARTRRYIWGQILDALAERAA